MVFESIVADLINRFLGEYVENLDRKQLKIGLFGGDIVLNDLIIKNTVLNELDLPITVTYARLGKLILKIPYTEIYKAPVVAIVERLYILAVPNNSIVYDSEKEKKALEEAKRNEILKIEKAKLDQEEKDKPKLEKGFAEKLVAQIINNIQIKINDVHIRYEDRYTTQTPFAFGVTLSKLSVHTTNENWIEEIVQASVTKIFKVAQLEGLAVYLNHDAKLFCSEDISKYPTLFKESIASKTEWPSDYNYIFGPISLLTKLQLNPKPEEDDIPYSIPKIKLGINMEKLRLGISREQYKYITQLIEVMGRMVRGTPYRKFRPTGVPYHGNFRLWWKFAYQCILEVEVRRRRKNWNWQHISEHRNMCRAYADLYRSKLTSKKPQADILKQIEEYEMKLDIYNIIIIRQKIELEVEKLGKLEKEEPKKGWFSGWWSGKENQTKVDDSDDIKKKFEAAMTNEEKAKLYDAIGYQENYTPTEDPESFIGTDITFELDALEVIVRDELSKSDVGDLFEEIIFLQLKGVVCNLQQRSAASALRCGVQMDEFRIEGVKQDGEKPLIVSSNIVDSSGVLLDISFETNPIDKKCDQRIKISSKPIQIVYDAKTIIQLIKIFQTPQTTTISQLQNAATEKIMNIKERSATGLQYAISKHTRLELDIAFMPSYLIVPYGGAYKRQESVLVLSLGKLMIKTEPRQENDTDIRSMHQAGVKQEEIMAEIISRSYDKFAFEIQDVQAIVAKPNENWLISITNGVETKMHLLQPTSLKVLVHLCVIDDDPRLPKAKVAGELSSVNVCVTQNRIMELISILTSIPLPETDTVHEAPLTKDPNRFGSSISLLKYLDDRQKNVNVAIPEPTYDLDETEVTQFTDIEISFILNEFSLTICNDENSSKSSSDIFVTPTSEFPTTPVNEVLSQAALSFDYTLPFEKNKMLSCKVKQLEISLVQRTYDLKIDLKLGAIAVDQYRKFNDTEQILNIINTPKYDKNSDYLFILNYVNCKRMSPEFSTKYGSVEQLLEINFSTLLVLLHQEGINELLEILNDIQTKVDVSLKANSENKSRIAKTSDEPIPATILMSATKGKLSAILEDETHGKSSVVSKKNSAVVDSIKFKVIAKFEDVAVELQNEMRSIAILEIQNLQAGVSIKSSYTDIKLKLQDIVVTDRNPDAVHTKILSIVGDNALSCELVLFNLDETSSYNSDNMNITITMGCAKIVFLNLFVSSVLDFLDNFQAAQQKIKDASVYGLEAAKTNVVEAYSQATRMKLNIKIKAPFVIVPIDSKTVEALAIDLGFLSITNKCTDVVTKHELSPAVIDIMKVELTDMKLSKVIIREADDLGHSRFGGDELNYGIKSDGQILCPTSFTLILKRNLSASWYKEQAEIDISGRIDSIELNIASSDYQMIMNILSKNMTETAVTKKPTAVEISSAPVKIEHQNSVRNKLQSADKSLDTASESTGSVAVQQQEKVIVDTFLKFSFQLNSIKINLFTAPNEGLAAFGLYYISLKGQKLVDSCLTTSIVLCDVHLDDTRSNRQNKITKFMHRRDHPNSDSSDPVRSMIDVTLNIKGNDTFADVKIFSFNLILSIDFLMKISNFFQTDAEPVQEIKNVPNKNKQIQAAATPSQKQDNNTTLTLLLHIEQPDIILVERMDDLNCYALFLNNEISLKVRQVGDKQVIKGEIQNFCLYLSEFNPDVRSTEKNYIIDPCSITLNGSMPQDDQMNISILTSDIKVSVSPSTIELLSNIVHTMTTVESAVSETTLPLPDLKDIWNEETFENDDFWFTKVDEPEEAIAAEFALVQTSKSESCVIQVPNLVIIIETGVGIHTIPMLFVEANMEAKIKNWSSDISVDGTLRLGISCYNNKMALWEPLLEPIEHELPSGETDYQLWELNFEMNIESQDIDELDEPNLTTKMKISSVNTLELTVTEMSLEVLQNLSNAFSDAMKPTGIAKSEADAPYVIVNDTGETVHLDLKKSGFIVYSNQKDTVNEDDVIVIAPNTRSFLQPEVETNVLESFFLSKSKKQSKAQERFLYVKIGDIEKEICLPVYKADYRYFPLYRSNQEPWAIVSEVKINLDSIHVTLRSIFQVHNHFTAPISIYCIENGQYKEIAEVLPNCRCNVPLYAVYLHKGEIYFSMQGYKPSAQGISWKEGSSNFNLSKSLQCDPLNTYEPFFINAIRERQEVFHEVTTRHTMLSASYIIHLRPTLTLKNCLPIGIQVCVLGCSVAREISLESPSANQGEDYLDYGIKEVKPGEILHLPTIKTSSKSKDNQTYIVVKLSQYLEKDWSCTTEIPSEPVDFVVWTFNSYDSVEIMSLQLGVRCENKNSGMMLTLYCPFWFINKTGLLLSYRASDESTNILYHPANLNQPILFSFKEKSFYGKKKATIRVGNGDWCEKFSLDTAGSSGVIACKTNDVTYQIAVHNTLTHNSLTKQIVFMPYYVVINRAPFTIEVQEHSRPADAWIKLKTDDCAPLWPKSDNDKTLHVKTEDTREVTHPFKYTDVQCTLLKLNNQYGGINVDVHVTEGAVYITFSNYHHGDAPALIINHTERPITFWEKGNVNKRSLSSMSKLLYTWVDPAGDRCIVWNNGSKTIENDLRKDGIGKFKYENSDESIWWISFLDGTQRILLFSKNDEIASATQATNRFNQVSQEISVAIHGIGLSLVNSVAQKDVMYVGIASSGVIWEEKKKSRFKSMKIHESQVVEAKYQEFLSDQINNKAEYGYVPIEGKLEVNFHQMKAKKSSEREIRRTFYPGLWVELKTSPYQMQLHAKINRIQIDNQLSDCIYPVVLAPVPPPRSVATSMELKPFIEMSVVQRIIPHSNVKQFKYLHVLMQEFHIKVDLMFINEIFSIVSSETTEEEAKELFIKDLELHNQPLLAHVTVQTQQEQKNFYDNLHLGPLKIHVSFSMAGSESSALPGILSTILQGVGVTLTDINDVVFRLAFFQREFQFLTQRQLTSECVSHYTGQALKQAYVLVLGLDVIGNPYGLVLGFTKGFEDLFYEPFQGAIQGPGEFAEGLVVGIRSLFGHTVGGAAGAVSKITGAVGKGLAALTFDKDYQKSRRDALNKKPENLQEGIARSGKGLVMGVFDGVTGVFTKPISGAKHEGVEGFFKGLGKGAVGLVARPTAGFVDFASGSFDAVKRATDLSNETLRLRPPRFLHSDNVLKPYSKKEAEGNKLLREVDKGKFAATDSFKNYEVIYENKEAILFTDHRIIYASKNDLFGGWQSEWSHQWNAFSTVTECDKGIELVLSPQKNKKGFKNMFASSEVGRKVVFVNSPEKRARLTAIMNQLISTYNNQ